jgi:hypothetical protein
MEIAKLLLRLWQLRRAVVLGFVVAIAAGAVSLAVLPSTVYSTASTQLIVDSPNSALGNPLADLTPYTTRAVVFSQLMTTPAVLQDIGKASGIPGNLIAASGPEVLGAPQATHAPTVRKGNKLLTGAAKYKLNLIQNPDLPTVDIYAEAPTTAQAISLANGAVTGLSNYMNTLDAKGKVKPGHKVTIRSAGAATGGRVDPGASKSTAVIIFAVVFIAWCVLLLFFLNLRENLRVARRMQPQGPGSHIAVEHLPPTRIGRRTASATTNGLESGEIESAGALPSTTGPNSSAGGSGEVVRRAWLGKSS